MTEVEKRRRLPVAAFRELKRIALDNHVILLYCGPFSRHMVGTLGDALRQEMASEDVSTGLFRKVFSVFIELGQNILHYAEPVDEAPIAADSPTATPAEAASADGLRAAGPGGAGYGVIAIGEERGTYFVISENSIPAEREADLRARLEGIQRMSPEEIKQAYKRQLREERDAHSKGAGLGFLEIARRSTAPLEFWISKTDDEPEVVMFTLKAYI